MNVVIFGLGLIGGSVAKDLRQRNFASKLIGVGRSEATNKVALDLGLVDKILPKDEAIKQADLIILTVPVNALVDELKYVLDNIEAHQVVTDMGSTKGIIIDAIKNHPKRKRYVSSHPMAGTENSGPTAAIYNLFDNKVCIICDKENSDADAVQTVEALYQCLKMNIKYMDAYQHDIHAAYVSHISHISSFVLAAAVLEKEVNEKAILEMAGGGFESTVRLAKSSPDMWAPIFMQNKENIIEVMDTYINKMQHFRDLIKKDEYDELKAFMKDANQIKKILK
ncbi:MAG: prephenate dehydrogenase [Sphingobacteriales bacterium]|nr:MAG: prephenate dehydrogenase [Sphingobacteriales bacterium]